MHTLTRQQLFEMAWVRPLTDVAAELGVTSTAVKKTCRRHNIPTPSRGYWAQVRAGRTFPRPKLSSVADKRLEQIYIAGAVTPPPPVQVAQAKARAALAREGGASEAVAKPAPAAAQEEPDERPEPKILAATRRALSKAKPEAVGFIHVSGKGVVACKAGEPSIQRIMDVLTRLVIATEALAGGPPRPMRAWR